jgi:hypothetical protein
VNGGGFSKEQLELQAARWRIFNQWERDHPTPRREAAEVVADLGMLLSWVSVEDRLTDPDPGKSGVRKMIAALATLKR